MRKSSAPAWREQIKSAGDAILRRKQDLTDAVIDEQDLERYFLEELNWVFPA